MDSLFLKDITPEMVGMATNDISLVTPDNNFDTNGLIYELNNYMFSEPIIKILHNIRTSKNKKIFTNLDSAIEYVDHETTYLYKTIEKHNMTKTCQKIKFKIPRYGDLIESIVVGHYKSIKIFTQDNMCVLFHSCTTGEKQQYELYDSTTQQIIEGFLLGDHNIPLGSVIFNELLVEIEFEDILDDNIGLIYVMCQNNLRILLATTLFELDMQKDKFIIFGNGNMADHFTDIKSSRLNKIFDQAHLESKKRKQLNYL